MADRAGPESAGPGLKFRASALVKTLADLLWPPVCAVCPRCLTLAEDPHDPATHFCSECLEELEFMPEAGCPVCGRPFFNAPEGPYSTKAAVILERIDRAQAESLPHPTGDHLCGDCLAGPPVYNSAKSALVYAGAAARSIVRLKYYGEKSQIKTLSALVERRLTVPLLPDGSQPDLIVPMPISAERRAERGFNQAFELARTLYRPWRKLIDDAALTRPADGNIHQAALSADDRRKAVRGCFKVPKPSKIKGAKVLLFDDVLTTGATAGEAARILLTAGAARVDVVTVARTILKAWR